MNLGKGQNIPQIFPFYSIYVDRWALHFSFRYKGFKAMGKAVDFPEIARNFTEYLLKEHVIAIISC